MEVILGESRVYPRVRQVLLESEFFFPYFSFSVFLHLRLYIFNNIFIYFRLFLHPEWRGLRDAELSKVSSIEGCVFAHASGFIGGNKTKEGALQMAIKSLDQPLPCKE